MNDSPSLDDLEQIDPEWAWQPYAPDDRRPWNRRMAAHLYRRAGFGARWSELEQAVQQGPQETIERLLDASAQSEIERQMDDTGRTVAGTQNLQRLAGWWLLRMARTPHPLLEKMTLFWHGHFATSGAKVRDGRSLLAQNELLRSHALGDFAALVRGMVRDVAMLVYLDTTDNRKTRPNENFGRELLELFCLGLGNYNEQDIKELARCFTGWEVRGGQFRFNPHQFDGGSKTAFGQSGNFDADQAVDIVLSQPAAGRFIAGKLLRYFLCDDGQFPAVLVEPLARQWTPGNLQIQPLVKTILSSNLFFSPLAVGQKIKSPVELAVGLIRNLEIATNMDPVCDQLETLGQLPYFPPSVKGWDGGRNWINAATLLGRNRLAVRLLDAAPEGALRVQSGSPTDATLVDLLSEMWLAVDLTDDRRQLLLDAASGSRRSGVERSLELTRYLINLPEFQLS